MKSLVKHSMFLALIVLGATGVWAQTNNTINLATVTSNITVNNGYTLTGTLGANVQISIANGATVTLNNVTINGVDNGSYNWAGITCNGNATLILVGENTVKGFNSDRPGIYVPENSTLTIQGSGSLTASSNGNGVGIGGNKSGSGGNIIIAGGTITATGGNECAGIGGGQGGSCGNISITSGIVIATGGNSASGIGGGQGGSCGNISITGGTVTATGGNSAPGIGGGGSSCNINISGGMVTATGGNSAPGIGGKQSGGCGTITIANTVTGVRAVKGGNSPHSIGAGQGGGCGTVTVNGISSNGISTNPYSYPSYILTDIPNGWSVNADNINVTVTNGEASIPVGADVVLTPPSADKPRVKNVELLSPEQVPLTFEAKTTDGATVTFNINTAAATNTVQYSTDGNTWNDYTSGDEIPLNNIGDKVSFRGNNEAYAYSSESDVSYFSCSADCYVYGNVMSLIDAEHYPDSTGLPSGHTFCSLFNNNSYIYNHPTKTLVLPATTLKEYCYAGMFKGCTNLTTAPALPATEMAELCYLHMFDGCISLTMAPELPATTLASQCYSNMFQGCTSLETAPALPATTLAGSCYNNMFNGCSNLQTAPQLLATTLASGCYEAMFYNCTSLTTAPALPATNLVTSCYSAMFHGCTSLATAPVLPATALESNCYFEMFSGCSNLNSVTCLATPNTSDTYEWLKDVAETGTFIKSAAVTGWLIDDPSGIPEGWTVKDHETFLPLTFEAKEANATVTFTKSTNTDLNGLSVEYSTDGTTWKSYKSDSTITLSNVGDKVSFRGNNRRYAKDDQCSTFSCTDCYVYGNIMSLINKDTFATITSLHHTYNSYAFKGLFENANIQDNGIYNHPSKELILPATTLAPECYAKMFSYCSHLTSAPALPATTLASHCYESMFGKCTHLTSAPALPATTLAEYCYASMFAYCDLLTTAPELPATTLADYCYSHMFSSCPNLTTIPNILPATTLKKNCYQYMFSSCTSLTSAPILPAPTLTTGCYQHMFQECHNLNSVTCLATDIPASSCTNYWLYSVASTGTFNKAASMTTWPTGPYNNNNVNGIPVGWTVVNEGALPGEFTVNANGGKVNFSMGNLQASTSDLGTNWKWSFANHQYVFIGNNAANNSIIGNGTVSTNGTVDLFGWSTAATEYGIHNSKSSAYTGDFVDWGSRIGTGWRTLTGNDNGEWRWLLGNSPAGNNVPGTNCRTSSTVNGVANARFSHIKVDGVCGLIIFPDIYTHPDGVTPIANINQYYVSWTNITTNYSTSDWAKMEKAGAVFLPMAGQREGNTVKFYYNYDNSNKGSAFYWSSTLAGDGSAYGIGFGSTTNEWNLSTNSSSMRYMGRSVRLVKNITGSGSLSYATTEVNKTTADAAFTNPLTMVGDGTVTYAKSDDNNNICTVNANTGEVTLNGNTGSCTITATVANSPFFNYATNTASYTLTVTPATPLQIPLTIEAKIAPATVTFTKGSNVTWTNPVEYSLNGGAWTEYASGTGITLTNIGDKVSFRGNNARYATADEHSCFSCDKDCYIYGNVMSLINSTDYANTKVLTQNYALRELFYNNTHIVNHSSKTLVLPATTLTPWCYYGMFNGCTGLKTAPALPATNLAEYCYSYMFSNCTSLTTAPILPAPALVNRCYYYMFSGCTNLNRVTCLATSGINLSSSTSNWLGNVASSGTFTKNASTPAGSSGTSGQYWKTDNANGIPEGWTVADYIPEHLTGSGTSGDPYKIYNLTHWNEFAAKVNDGSEPAAHAKQMANIDVNNVQNALTIIGTSSHPFKGTYNGQGYTISQVNISGSSNNGNAYVGLFGYVDDASALIQNVVVASGSISVTGAASDRLNVGAIVGWLNKGTVQYCANYATVSSSSFSPSFIRCGGIVGIMYEGNANVQHCINFGDVSTNGTSGYYTGGIVGYVNLGSLTYCQNYGKITAKQCASGIGGYRSTNYGSIIINNNHNGGNLKISSTPYPAYNLIINDPNNESCPENSYLTSMTLTIGSNNYTGNDLSTYANGATGVTANPSGITIGGVTYAGPSGN